MNVYSYVYFIVIENKCQYKIYSHYIKLCSTKNACTTSINSLYLIQINGLNISKENLHTLNS